MKKAAILALVTLFSLGLSAQVVVDLVAAMDGTIQLEGGGTTILWGYGYPGPGGITLPAPLIEVDLGDDVVINMENISPESHTIHPHGLDVDQVNDGVPATSFLVPPMQIGTYSFTADEAGTFLYHCHVTTTIHLTMGMYGMIIVKGPDNTLFEGGPEYDFKKEFLFSDLEIAANDAPTMAFPFHDITPDYFMVNGLQGQQILDDDEQQIFAEEGQAIALYLGSMAYSIATVHFPEELHATVWMSDGRPVPTEFEVTELEIYPGERFTVMLNPEAGFSEDIEVEYINMLNDESQHINTIPVHNLSVGVEANTHSNFEVWPNPTTGLVTISSPDAGAIYIYDAFGKLVVSQQVKQDPDTIDLRGLSAGIYLLSDEVGSTIQLVIE